MQRATSSRGGELASRRGYECEGLAGYVAPAELRLDYGLADGAAIAGAEAPSTAKSSADRVDVAEEAAAAVAEGSDEGTAWGG